MTTRLTGAIIKTHHRKFKTDQIDNRIRALTHSPPLTQQLGREAERIANQQKVHQHDDAGGGRRHDDDDDGCRRTSSIGAGPRHLLSRVIDGIMTVRLSTGHYVSRVFGVIRGLLSVAASWPGIGKFSRISMHDVWWRCGGCVCANWDMDSRICAMVVGEE